MYFRLLVLSAVDDECDAGMDQDEIEQEFVQAAPLVVWSFKPQ